MNENNISATQGDSFIAPVSQSRYVNDIIDLTEMDGDECEVTSTVMVLNNSSCSQPSESESLRDRGRRKTNSSENNPSKAQSEAADDSICILYENIQPPPDVAVVNEIINNIDENESVDNIEPGPVSPTIMGTVRVEPHIDFYQTIPLTPEITFERTISIYRHANHSQNARRNESSCHPLSVVIEPHTVVLQNSRPTAEEPLNLKTVPSNHSSVIENPNTVAKAPKILCGICLDGPDEISASERNLTSTNCGHVFCNVCIKTSMKSVSKCPKCRKKITSRSIHPLYL